MTLLPEHAHSLVIERLRKRAAHLAPPADWMQSWLATARITVESQQLYGNFHMRMKTMLQAIGEGAHG